MPGKRDSVIDKSQIDLANRPAAPQYRVAHLLRERNMLTSNSKFHWWPGSEEKLSVKRNFTFVVNIFLSPEADGPPYSSIQGDPKGSVHAQSHNLDIGARLKWGEQGPCMCQKVEKLAKKVKGS